MGSSQNSKTWNAHKISWKIKEIGRYHQVGGRCSWFWVMSHEALKTGKAEPPDPTMRESVSWQYTI